MRLLVVIAGHNGAGKTTFYRKRLSHLLEHLLEENINADEIERAITEELGENAYTKKEFENLAADEATRLRKLYLQEETNFSFETVFSDPVQDKVGFMADARRCGYLVVLLAVGLESIEKSKERVAIRHARGGHNVAPKKLEERYPRVLVNFAHGARVASLAIFMDNSEDNPAEDGDAYWGIAFFEDGHLVVSDDSPPDWWHEVLRQLHPVPTAMSLVHQAS